ncbi:hypothetical protein [Bifidobacterium sp. ESL0790]|uniref:hypothetical protein n=1 Tax=Bifidobacterium sp. ESL0790 TaxID=2983233 RepID=UPI0023F8169D|nr:hypothetical protein [Bifidobacterium sp. ESL0790]WEV72253.1 hypothetical protein OZY47_07430 [Bifidobacterium sp. ESL0790]
MERHNVVTLSEAEIYEQFDITEQEIEESVEALKNGTFHVDLDSVAHVRPMTPEMQESINRAWDYWDAQDAKNAKKQVAAATA